VILGANLGTTSTSWIVTYLGFKLKMSAISYPLIAAGALLKLFSDHRSTATGTILAGFGMIFVGIDTLQGGMSGIASTIDPAAFTGLTLTGKFGLLAVGIVMTIITQSSSAAMVATLAALNSGTISIEQAALMAIGQNIGTTFISAIGAIGATTPAKRTALAHISFNILCGAAVFLLLPAFIGASRAVSSFIASGENVITLAAFHTLFNLAGALAVLPFMPRFAALITRILPDRGPGFTRNLDSSVLMVPQVALESSRRALADIAGFVITHLVEVIRGMAPVKKTDEVLKTARYSLLQTQKFLREVRSFNNSPLLHERHTNLIHSVDHIYRLIETCGETARLNYVLGEPGLSRIALQLADKVESLLGWLKGEMETNPREVVEKASLSIAGIRKDQRKEVLEKTSTGEIDAETAFTLMESMRWLDRIAYHIWRAVTHLEDIKKASPPGDPST
jgi:phosphate:Na+ symporter